MDVVVALAAVALAATGLHIVLLLLLVLLLLVLLLLLLLLWLQMLVGEGVNLFMRWRLSSLLQCRTFFLRMLPRQSLT